MMRGHHSGWSIGYANVCHQSCSTYKTAVRSCSSGVVCWRCGSRWWDFAVARVVELSSADRQLYHCKEDWLVVKQEHLEHAQDIFAGTGIQITSTGGPHLGAAFSSTQFMQEYAAQCVGQWTKSLNRLPRHNHMCLTQHLPMDYLPMGFHQHGHFFFAPPLGLLNFFLLLEQVIHHHFLPCLVFHPPNDVERPLFALPAHLGGLSIFNPCVIAAETYQFSRHVAGPIVECILNQHSSLLHYILNGQHTTLETSLEPSTTHLLILLSLFMTNVYLIYNIYIYWLSAEEGFFILAHFSSHQITQVCTKHRKFMSLDQQSYVVAVFLAAKASEQHKSACEKMYTNITSYVHQAQRGLRHHRSLHEALYCLSHVRQGNQRWQGEAGSGSTRASGTTGDREGCFLAGQ